MTERLARRRELGYPHWTPRQRRRLRECMESGDTIAYWCSDAHGLPINHSCGYDAYPDYRAHPGLVQKVSGPLQMCSKHALHATKFPHRQRGSRVWIVVLRGEIEWYLGNCCALEREILGEILPWEAMSPSVGARLGRKDLAGADLVNANLVNADLTDADLTNADLTDADLTNANLIGADLIGANLTNADLIGADLTNADLTDVDLTNANLIGAILTDADLTGANIDDARRDVVTWTNAISIEGYTGPDITPPKYQP